MATKFFDFPDRHLEIRFFEDDPVILDVLICEDTDKTIDAAAKKIRNVKASDSADELEKMLVDLLGKDQVDAILEHANGYRDAYTFQLIWGFIFRTYVEGKQKNVEAAWSGRQA